MLGSWDTVTGVAHGTHPVETCGPWTRGKHPDTFSHKDALSPLNENPESHGRAF